MHGLTRALLANMVTGVTDGFERVLEIEGTGYRADEDGGTLMLNVGYSHPVRIQPPDGISFTVEDRGKRVIVRGIDKEEVGPSGGRTSAGAPAGALQGQGHSVRRRAHPAQGRQGRKGGTLMATNVAAARRRARMLRHARVRRRLAGTAARPRLAVFRSLRHIYAQVIDDVAGHTLGGGLEP